MSWDVSINLSFSLPWKINTSFPITLLTLDFPKTVSWRCLRWAWKLVDISIANHCGKKVDFVADENQTQNWLGFFLAKWEFLFIRTITVHLFCQKRSKSDRKVTEKWLKNSNSKKLKIKGTWPKKIYLTLFWFSRFGYNTFRLQSAQPHGNFSLYPIRNVEHAEHDHGVATRHSQPIQARQFKKPKTCSNSDAVRFLFENTSNIIAKWMITKWCGTENKQNRWNELATWIKTKKKWQEVLQMVNTSLKPPF